MDAPMWPDRRVPYRRRAGHGSPPPGYDPDGQPYGQPMRVQVSYQMPGYGFDPYGRDELVVTRGRFHLSQLELEELKRAFLWMCLIFAFGITGFHFEMLDGNMATGLKMGLIGVGAGALALLTGFVCHEIAHKLVAQHYGYWAEFRSNENGLMWGLILAAVLGFIFVAPGAVMIRGHVTKREEGHISIAGPASNMAWALLALPLYFLVYDWSGHDLTTAKYIAYRAVFFLLWINIALGAFNLIPLRPLDGSKIWSWSAVAYLGCVAAIVGLIYLGWQVVPSL